MSHERLALALLRGRQYYGRVLRSLQGLPDRHRCMQPVVKAAAVAAGHRSLQVLEIGTWAGASAVSWARALKELPHGGKVVCVDAWQPYFNLDIERDPLYAEMNRAAEHGDVFRLFLHNVRCANVDDVVEYRVGASQDVLPQFEPSSFDVVYVDGSHALKEAATDLSHASRLIRPGGIVCGDDLELQRDELDPDEHRSSLALDRDYVWAESARAHYHPGVTEAVAQSIGRVFTWNGFWIARRTNTGWTPLALEPGGLPDHVSEAVRESLAEEPVVPQHVGETAAYNLVRLGQRYVAAAKALGELSLGVDRVGDKELEPVLLIGDSLEEVRERAMAYEGPQFDVVLIDQTATHNLVRFGTRYVALDRALGPMSLGRERMGERELKPYILIGETLEELRERLAHRGRKRVKRDAS
jgi:predicted O-methyltransferase YrrM